MITHTTLIKDRDPWCLQDLNPQSQQTSDHRLTPQMCSYQDGQIKLLQFTVSVCYYEYKQVRKYMHNLMILLCMLHIV